MKKVSLAFLFVLAFTSFGNAASTHVWKNGETLWDLANSTYGNPYLWTAIADVNDCYDPTHIITGQTYIIPSKSEAEAIYNEKDHTKKAELIAKLGGKTTPEENKPQESSTTDPEAKEGLSFEKIIETTISDDAVEEVSTKNLSNEK